VKVLLRTFGCRANHYDAEQVRAMVEGAGAGVVTEGDADVAVLTSCAVTSDAEADLRQAVRRLVRDQPGIRVVVTGCASARSPRAIAALPNVAAVIAGADLLATVEAVGLAPSPVQLRRATRQSTARATLRVQEGCDEHCTFCATTLARGAHRSRTVEELVREAQALEEHHSEIVLTGIHVGSWGKERGATLGSLVRALVDGTRRARFRLASVEATEVDEDLAELLRDGADRVCPYLHAPLQSGSDRVLKRMGRHWYSARQYARAIERLTAGRPIFGLGADVMAGFPGETEADHAETLALVRDLPFSHLHIFPYSARPGTSATQLGAQVPASLARTRASALRTLAAAKQAAYAASRIGTDGDLVIISAPEHRGDDAAPFRRALSEDYLEVRVMTSAPRSSRISARFVSGTLCEARSAVSPHPAS